MKSLRRELEIKRKTYSMFKKREKNTKTEGTWTLYNFVLIIRMQMMIVVVHILFKKDQNKADLEKEMIERWNAKSEAI